MEVIEVNILSKTNLSRFENIVNRLDKMVFINKMSFPNKKNQEFIHNIITMMGNYLSKIEDKDLKIIGYYTDIPEIKFWVDTTTYCSPDSLVFLEFIVKRLSTNFYFVYDITISWYKQLFPEEENISRNSIKYLLGADNKPRVFNLAKSFPTTKNIHANPEGTLLCYEYIKRNADQVDEGILIWKDKMFKDYPKSSLPCFIRPARLALLMGDSIMQYRFAGRASLVSEINTCKYVVGLALSMLYCIDIYGISSELKEKVEGYFGYSLSELSEELYELRFNVEYSRIDTIVCEFMINNYKPKLKKFFTIICYSHNFKLYEEYIEGCSV